MVRSGTESLMARKPLSVIVTGAGAPGIRGTIYALRNNPDGFPVRIIGVDRNPDVAGRFLVDQFYQVPDAEDQSYIETLTSICRREGAGIVIPQTTREVDVLSEFREHLLGVEISVMVSNRCAMEIANNKFRLLEEFKRLGLPSPAYSMARTEEELVESVSALGYPRRPVVVKPPSSNGMRGVRILKENAWDACRFLTEKPAGLEISLQELLSILRRGRGWPELLVMEYLPGSEYSVDVFRGQKVEFAIPRLRKSIRSGITFEAALDFREDVRTYALRAAKHIGLQYAFGFQFKLDDCGIPKILECNPRVQGTMAASLLSGWSVIWLAVKELIGEPAAALPPMLENGLFYRFWGGIGVSEGNTVYEI
jgi:carbamoyl-phosphate synthase large subunit